MSENINALIERIRQEEREKILKQIEEKDVHKDAWKKITDYIEDWGKENYIYLWKVNKIKNAIYIIIRFSLDIDRMAHLREEQLDIALEITETILGIMSPE